MSAMEAVVGGEAVAMGDRTNLVCWHDWVEHCPCPWRDAPRAERDLIIWGRCRSGRRWFWAAIVFMSDPERSDHGWVDTEDEAVSAARASVVDLAAGRPAIASMKQGQASYMLKKINAEKRRQRPSNGNTDAGAVEYLYGEWWNNEDCVYRVVKFQITKKTAKRIYYIRREFDFDEPEIGYVSRQKLEADGEVRNRGVHWSSRDSHLYAEPPEPPPVWVPLDVKARLSQLRAEMAAAHPDRGGTNAAFIEAHRQYQQARRRVSR